MYRQVRYIRRTSKLVYTAYMHVKYMLAYKQVSHVRYVRESGV